MVFNVPVDDPWGTNKSKTFKATIKVEPNGATQTLNHGVKPVSVKQRPVYGEAALIDGWREPTVFRGYVMKNICEGEFDYLCYTGGKIKRHKGSNYPSSTTDIYCGTEGSGRYPINTGMDDRARNQALAKANRAEFQVGVFVSELSESVFLLGRLFRDLAKYMKAALAWLKESLVQKTLIDSKAAFIRKIQAREKRKLSAKRAQERWAAHIKAVDLKDPSAAIRRRQAIKDKAAAQAQRVVRTPADKSGRVKLEKILGDALLNRWLEFQYGWKPLLNDIYGIAGLIEEQLQRRLTVKAIANPSDIVGPSTVFAPPGSGSIYVDDTVVTGAKCRLDFVIQNAVAAHFNRMGLANVLEIAWELVPFSFVIDWLLPVGSYLGALSGSWGLTFKGGSITRYTTADVNVEWTQYQYISGERIRYNVKSVSWFRYPISDLTPSPVRLQNPLTSVSRALTSLALVTQILSRKG